MSNSQPPKTSQGYWRSIRERDHGPTVQADEFPGLKDTLESTGGGLVQVKRPAKGQGKGRGLGRRKFFGVMGASTALATSSCVRKPVERILPYARRPEDLIPGKPLYYASAFVSAGSVAGVLVESQDGRPTKIEGNPRHSGSQGASSAFAQASVIVPFGAGSPKV